MDKRERDIGVEERARCGEGRKRELGRASRRAVFQDGFNTGTTPVP